MATWNDVRRLALALPGTTEEKSRDHAAWLVNNKFFVWERPLRKSDLAELGASAPKGPILGIRTPDIEMKEILIASDPGIFFATSHFNGYPAVLIQLTKITAKKLKEVIVEAWLARAPSRAVDEYVATLRTGSVEGPRKKSRKRKR